MAFHANIIQGIVLDGLPQTIINFIGGSNLDHQRYLALWAINGYDVTNPDFLRWLFGVNGNNTQRAGALTADMLGGHELILMESSVWKTINPGQGGIGGLGSSYTVGGSTVLPPNPVVMGPIIWVIIAAIALFMSKQK